jgi:hypothetical protein
VAGNTGSSKTKPRAAELNVSWFINVLSLRRSNSLRVTERKTNSS